MMSDSESDMDTKSEKSCQTFTSRSFRSGILKPATSLTDCRRLKETMEKLPSADQPIIFFANQIECPTPGDPTDVYIQLMEQKSQERETGKRASNFTAMHRPQLPRSFFICPGRI
ncbi:hypothetical protein TNIN_13311 [Trichonephila inaurata madagascariensis]|uniref:Uncharacterized protein n=1 Tax=Trichonephila inaurata madagascariensis TaxID=2747483 RepID=A0A8X6WN50_9ARAC|nr:hypothetical protein TNIN_13311 [Trichonephila inaurata madagascariensis]